MVYRTLACSALFLLALAPVGAQAPAGKEELKLKLPKPMFVGTPTNIRSPNLEKVTGKSRGAFYVPKGTVLLSLKKKITSSDSAPVIGELDEDQRRREGGRRRVLRRAGPDAAVDPGRPRRLAPALGDPGVALPQPGSRLP
jgi:hypothetical protein